MNNMTTADAFFIRSWRKGKTYQEIATTASKFWPDKNYIPDDERQGRDIAYKAATLVNEYIVDLCNSGKPLEDCEECKVEVKEVNWVAL